MIWFLADTHFNHSAIVQYCGRPFKDAKDMDDTIIRNWNEIVKPEDTVYHLGDFALAHKERYQEYLDALNGRIIVVMGNHDRRRTVTFWAKRGVEAHKLPIFYEGIMLSHEPYEFTEEFIKDSAIDFHTGVNIHGHTHGNEHRGEVPEMGIHICVSVEATGYKPVSLDWIKEEIKRRREENGR